MARGSTSGPRLADSLTPFRPSLPTEFRSTSERKTLQAQLETTEVRFAQLLEQLQESFGQRSEIVIRAEQIAASIQWLHAAVNRPSPGGGEQSGLLHQMGTKRGLEP